MSVFSEINNIDKIYWQTGPNIVSDRIKRAYATNNAGVPSLVFVDADLEGEV